MKKAIVIGASSGIGRELAKILSTENYIVGLAGRRLELLSGLQRDLTGASHVKRVDVSESREAIKHLEELIREINGLDLIVISSGVGFINPELDWKAEKDTIDVNVSGFVAMANVAFKHFLKQGAGQLVGISSIAALRGSGEAPAYNASKAFILNYLEGLRHMAVKAGADITIIDIRPGFVNTAMAKGDGLFWVASPEKAAQQIYMAIKGRKKYAYITRRWRLIAWLLKVLPDWVYGKL